MCRGPGRGETAGAGQVCLDVQHDGDGEYPDGGSPVLVDDRLQLAHAGPVDADLQKPDVSPRQNPGVNDDGVSDVYAGPDTPGADLENTWVKTHPGKRGACFRFRGPLQPCFGKTWAPPSLEKAG